VVQTADPMDQGGKHRACPDLRCPLLRPSKHHPDVPAPAQGLISSLG